MDDQKYAHPSPPAAEKDWVEKYNTRWVGPMVFSKRVK
jgi:hypothetical protein